MKKQCGFLLLYVVVAVLLLPLLLTMLCGGLGQELPQEAQALYGLADLAPLDTELEEYVAGVVAAEMPAAFPEEALKAQAVAARTYQVRQMQAAGSRAVLYDVGQAYLSEAEQKEKWGEGYALYAGKIHSAVRATAGEIMTYDGEPILAAFHAQSGGRTEDAAHVWNTAVPYLKSVDSPEGDEVPNYHSQVVLSSRQVQEAALAAYPGADLSGEPSSWFGPAVRDEGGTVTSIPFGGLTLTGGQVRSMLSLRSAAFTVTWDGENFTFDVTGYGHGVGMSQYGANAMAKGGKNFTDILTWYYTGTQVDALW